MNQVANRIELQLERLLARHLAAEVELESATHLTRDLGLESVQVMEFVVDIEDHYDVSIDLKSLSDVHTLGEMTVMVMQLLDEQG